MFPVISIKPMKQILNLLIIISLSGCKQDSLKLISDDELIRRIVENEMPKPEDVQIFDVQNNVISKDSLTTLESSGKYFEDFYVNEKGKIVKIVTRLKTAKDEELIAKINQKLNQPSALKSVEIDCTDKINILQHVFDRDQKMRQNGGQIDSKIDHENLEIVVSFLEKCGMPSLKEVNEIQMAGIWGVLQHAPPEYQSKYISLLEDAANKGDIKWNVIAMMKDRALMHEGKPQIYGSQVSNGKLYDLFEPEYVNQRRQKVDMEPLEVYLQKFDIEFKVTQKTK